MSDIVESVTLQRREDLFHESPAQLIKRIGLSTAYGLKKNGLSELLPYWRQWASERMHPRAALPDPEQPYDGVKNVGLVHDLSVETLTAAYKRGLFRAGHYGTLAWASPPERCVLFLDETRIGKNVKRLMKQNRYRVTFDQDFEQVIHACASPRKARFAVTWITPRIMRAYAKLYDAGLVHSFEVWDENTLVGGGYGVALGRAFFTESQFSFENNTSKYGFAVLNWHLRHWGYRLNDGKNVTPTLTEAGFRAIPRAEFLCELDATAHGDGKPGRWHVEMDAAQCVAGSG